MIPARGGLAQAAEACVRVCVSDPRVDINVPHPLPCGALPRRPINSTEKERHIGYGVRVGAEKGKGERGERAPRGRIKKEASR